MKKPELLKSVKMIRRKRLLWEKVTPQTHAVNYNARKVMSNP